MQFDARRLFKQVYTARQEERRSVVKTNARHTKRKEKKRKENTAAK